MEYGNLIFIGLIVLFLIYRLMPTKGVKQISTAQLKDELNDKNKYYIDVRTPGEFNGNHIRGFKNIPLHTINLQSVSQLSIENEVIVICQSGMRSNTATKQLKKLGFKKITNVKGGMSAWS